MLQKILVWDAPTRAYHWLQALSFIGAYLTSDSEKYRDIHVALGYILFGLIAFRLLWGFIGSRYAKFSSFLFKPGQITAYLKSLLKGKSEHFIGHNPLGSVAIWLLLGLGITLCVTGVMLMRDEVADIVEKIHDLATDALLVVVAIHLAGVLVSSILEKQNLVRAMITGAKFAEPEQGIKHSYNWLAFVMLALVVVFGYIYLHK